jgi:hypothetical protein
MRSISVRSMLLPLGFGLAAGGAVPGAVSGQNGFLFRAPVAAATLRAGPMLYSATGDVFADMTKTLTLSRGDFRGPAVGGEVVFMPSSRVDVVLGVMTSATESDSEFKDWLGSDDLPIEQVTRLRTIPVTASLRYLMVPRGRRLSRLSWLPSAVVPYVGAGGGITWYRLEQEGEFVALGEVTDEDIESCLASGINCPDIVSDKLDSRGQQATFHALAGLDYWFAARFGVNAEARYTYGSAKPNNSFSDFDSLDLGGLQATFGLSIRW